MFDLSSKFNTFYNTKVVLPQEEQNELHSKKDINLQRLTDGLIEYNEENSTDYSIVETCVQGSMAMSTVVQNDNKDYDIDVAVVFDIDNLNGLGALATRRLIADALRRKTKQFNTEPEIKTSCVRVKYADGYHIDFAIFRRSWDDCEDCWRYEHAGSEWTYRDLRGLTSWFKTQNDAYDDKLRIVVRLSKMFCNSRDSWKNMPSGLIQTVLCDEKLQWRYDRLDELFYYTMKRVAERLESNKTVIAPVDNGRNLTPREKDKQKMNNWLNRLKSKLDDLEILFVDDCSKEEALQAWYSFFNHDYWYEQAEAVASCSSTIISRTVIQKYDDTEEFIEEKYPVRLVHSVSLDCTVSANGFRTRPLSDYSSVMQRFIPKNLKVKCVISNTSVSSPYKALWKVKNVGPESQRKNDVRGQILERGVEIIESTKYYGKHYIECYIIKDGYCVARTKVLVPIGRR